MGKNGTQKLKPCGSYSETFEKPMSILAGLEVVEINRMT